MSESSTGITSILGSIKSDGYAVKTPEDKQQESPYELAGGKSPESYFLRRKRLKESKAAKNEKLQATINEHLEALEEIKKDDPSEYSLQKTEENDDIPTSFLDTVDQKINMGEKARNEWINVIDAFESDFLSRRKGSYILSKEGRPILEELFELSQARGADGSEENVSQVTRRAKGLIETILTAKVKINKIGPISKHYAEKILFGEEDKDVLDGIVGLVQNEGINAFDDKSQFLKKLKAAYGGSVLGKQVEKITRARVHALLSRPLNEEEKAQLDELDLLDQYYSLKEKFFDQMEEQVEEKLSSRKATRTLLDDGKEEARARMKLYREIYLAQDESEVHAKKIELIEHINRSRQNLNEIENNMKDIDETVKAIKATKSSRQPAIVKLPKEALGFQAKFTWAKTNYANALAKVQEQAPTVDKDYVRTELSKQLDTPRSTYNIKVGTGSPAPEVSLTREQMEQFIGGFQANGAGVVSGSPVQPLTPTGGGGSIASYQELYNLVRVAKNHEAQEAFRTEQRVAGEVIFNTMTAMDAWQRYNASGQPIQGTVTNIQQPADLNNFITNVVSVPANLTQFINAAGADRVFTEAEAVLSNEDQHVNFAGHLNAALASNDIWYYGHDGGNDSKDFLNTILKPMTRLYKDTKKRFDAADKVERMLQYSVFTPILKTPAVKLALAKLYEDSVLTGEGEDRTTSDTLAEAFEPYVGSVVRDYTTKMQAKIDSIPHLQRAYESSLNEMEADAGLQYGSGNTAVSSVEDILNGIFGTNDYQAGLDAFKQMANDCYGIEGKSSLNIERFNDLLTVAVNRGDPVEYAKKKCQQKIFIFEYIHKLRNINSPKAVTSAFLNGLSERIPTEKEVRSYNSRLGSIERLFGKEIENAKIAREKQDELNGISDVDSLLQLSPTDHKDLINSFKDYVAKIMRHLAHNFGATSDGPYMKHLKDQIKDEPESNTFGELLKRVFVGSVGLHGAS